MTVPKDYAAAQAFVTDSQTYRLDSVAMKIFDSGTGAAEVELQLRANDDAKNKPGAILESWPAVQITPGITEVSTRSSVLKSVLKADTKYWLVARTASGEMLLPGTQDFTQTGSGDFAELIEKTAYTNSPKWNSPTFDSRFYVAITVRPVPPPLIVSADAGGLSQVKVFDPITASAIASFVAFGTSTAGARVAGADFNGDGLVDFATGAGVGGGSLASSFQKTIEGKITTFKWTGAVVLAKGAAPGEAGGIFLRGDRSGAVSIAP